MELAIDNTLELRFVEETHQYFYGKRELPSVTTVLSEIVDFSMVKDEILENARVRGVAVHRATELDDTGDLDEASVHPIIRPYLEGWRKFKAQCHFKSQYIEERVLSKQGWYAGTLDRIGIFGGGPALVDLKARSSMTPEIGPQLAGYAFAWKEMTGEDLYNRRYSVQLKPDGTYRLHHYDNDRDLDAFLACLTLYNWRKSL